MVDDQYVGGGWLGGPQLGPRFRMPLEMSDEVFLRGTGGALDLDQARRHIVGADQELGGLRTAGVRGQGGGTQTRAGW
ncbi:hypothetical protein [Streptomyces sp. NPDC059378]|uniref:hypothetical protein n=1 Tax=Streptomyces sp. NPDC059378 TaxID=3346815 RepID=UPI0036AC54EE